MRNIWLIARREYLERVRAKSFLIMTILIPALLGGALFAMTIINGRGSSASHVAVVTTDSQFGLDMQTELQDRKSGKMQVDVISPPGADTRELLNDELKNRDLDGYLWVTPATKAGTRASFDWVPKSKADVITRGTIGDAVRAVLTREGLRHSGMGAGDVDTLMAPVDLDSSQLDKNDTAVTAIVSAYALFFLMYFTILFYGMNVARSIIEEKTSRIFEVLLSTIRPEEMLAGKVLGVGAVGLSQVGIWILAGGIYLGTGMAAAGFSVHLSFAQVIFFVIYFVLGYLLYSCCAAALGAMTSSEQELQQMNIFLMLPLIACSMVIFKVMTDSDGTLAKAFSFFPFCAPLIMYTRIAVHQPPAWQIELSLAEMVLTIAAVLWIASRIYRVGILMYGKKPSLPELLKWFKYS
jgi:ABC-2 type transport system permease protein